jgi:imidazolonepropionase-like amidohydrolase
MHFLFFILILLVYSQLTMKSSIPLLLIAATSKGVFACIQHLQHFSTSSEEPNHVRKRVPSPLGKTAITNVRVFDGVDMSPPRTIYIDREHISSTSTNVTNEIDASGQFLIPGLIDSHLHLDQVSRLEELTSYGVTTVFQMSCSNYTLCFGFKGHTGLAEVFTAGIPAAGPDGVHAINMHLPPDQIIYPSSDPQEWVENVFGNHSDYLKIVVESGGPSLSMQTSLVKATHALGKQTMSHASNVESYLEAIASHSNGIQHVPDDGLIPVSAIGSIKKYDQFVTPTMTLFKFGYDNPIVWQTLRGNSHTNTSYANVQANVALLHRHAVPILAGTDAVGAFPVNATFKLKFPHGLSLHQELQHLVDAGLSPAEAINSATRVAAKYHRLGDRGRITKGMRADLVLLRENPLMDISRTQDIERVWVGGREYLTGT